MFKNLFTKCARFKNINKLIIIVCIFMYSGCGGTNTPFINEVKEELGDISSNVESGNNSSNAESGYNSSNVETPEKSINLSWVAPELDADGLPLYDISGYLIYYINNDDTDNQIFSIDVGNVTSTSIELPSSGTWCFEVTAYTDSGLESDFSNQACIAI